MKDVFKPSDAQYAVFLQNTLKDIENLKDGRIFFEVVPVMSDDQAIKANQLRKANLKEYMETLK